MKTLFTIITIVIMLFVSVPKSEAFVVSGPVFGIMVVKTSPVWMPVVIGFAVTSSKKFCRIIPYGKQKKDGSHDLRYNIGKDRTPAQKAGDIARQKGG